MSIMKEEQEQLGLVLADLQVPTQQRSSRSQQLISRFTRKCDGKVFCDVFGRQHFAHDWCRFVRMANAHSVLPDCDLFMYFEVFGSGFVQLGHMSNNDHIQNGNIYIPWKAQGCRV